MEVTFAEVCATKISDLLAEGESIYDYFDMALEFIDNNDTTLQSFLLNELDDETFTQITQILTAININAFEFDVDFVLDTKGKISNINVDANADVKIGDANWDGNQLLADYTVTFSVNNVGTTEINPSFKTKTLDFASINLSTTRSDVIDSSKSEIKWLLTDKPISINDFEIRGTINEEEVVLVTYTSSMQILKINKDYLEAQLDDEYNYHQFILYVEEDVDEWDSYVAINLLVK